MPRFKRRRLQCAAVGETQLPGLLLRVGVHGVEIGSGGLIALSAGEEIDAGHGGRHGAAKTDQRRRGNFFRAGLLRTIFSGQHHVRLEQHVFQLHAMPMQRVEHGL